KNMIGLTGDPTRADYGFGLGLAVRTTPGIARMMGSVGDFSWPGASGTNWWVDPREELVVVFMAHTPGPMRWKYRQMSDALVSQARRVCPPAAIRRRKLRTAHAGKRDVASARRTAVSIGPMEAG